MFAAACAVAVLTTAQAVEFSLTISRLEAPGINMAPVRLRLIDGAPTTLQIEIGEVSVQGHVIRNVHATCADFSWTPERIECRKGTADLGPSVPLSFTYSFAGNALDLALRPAENEAWIVRASFNDSDRWIRVRVERGALGRIASWLPAGWPKFTGGILNGEITVEGRTYDHVRGDLAVQVAAFSDASGNHAAENLGADLRLTAKREKATWSYRAEVAWKGGEVVVDLGEVGREVKGGDPHLDPVGPGCVDERHHG